MTIILFAQAGEKMLLAEKILAVLGGAVVGGLGVGLLAQLLMRAFTTQKLPRWPLLTVRLLGAVIGGWLVALWVLGGGGAGFGGAGGWGLGSGPGQGGQEKPAETGKKDGTSKASNGESKTPSSETLRIEALGDATLSDADRRAERWYRLDTDEGSRLLTFAQVKEAIKQRQQESPPLRRIVIVVYQDSPAEDNLRISRLRAWAGDLNGGKMGVGISKPGTNAPKK